MNCRNKYFYDLRALPFLNSRSQVARITFNFVDDIMPTWTSPTINVPTVSAQVTQTSDSSIVQTSSPQPVQVCNYKL